MSSSRTAYISVIIGRASNLTQHSYPIQAAKNLPYGDLDVHFHTLLSRIAVLTNV